MIKKFTGYKGKMAMAQIGAVSFVILSKNDRDLTAVWELVMRDVELDPAGIHNAILIQSSDLPAPAPKPTTPSEPTL